MDGKKQIRIDSAQAHEVEQENIDLSLGFDVACSLWLIMTKGLKEVELDLIELKKARDKVNLQTLETVREDLALQVQVATLAYNNGKKFLDELNLVITELTPPDKKKVIIHKPNWKP